MKTTIKAIDLRMAVEAYLKDNLIEEGDINDVLGHMEGNPLASVDTVIHSSNSHIEAYLNAMDNIHEGFEGEVITEFMNDHVSDYDRFGSISVTASSLVLINYYDNEGDLQTYPTLKEDIEQHLKGYVRVSTGSLEIVTGYIEDFSYNLYDVKHERDVELSDTHFECRETEPKEEEVVMKDNTMTCPMCDVAELDYKVVKGIHTYTCPDCPFQGMEGVETTLTDLLDNLDASYDTLGTYGYILDNYKGEPTDLVLDTITKFSERTHEIEGDIEEECDIFIDLLNGFYHYIWPVAGYLIESMGTWTGYADNLSKDLFLNYAKQYAIEENLKGTYWGYDDELYFVRDYSNRPTFVLFQEYEELDNDDRELYIQYLINA